MGEVRAGGREGFDAAVAKEVAFGAKAQCAQGGESPCELCQGAWCEADLSDRERLQPAPGTENAEFCQVVAPAAVAS